MRTEMRMIKGQNFDIEALEESASLILKGEILVCPTDTGYAFTVDALNEEAVQKVFALKKRPLDNPIHMAVSSIDEAEKYANVNHVARVLAREFLPGALTLVMPRKEIVPSSLTAGRDTIGIRIPDNQAILTLVRMTDRPLTTTSANISGMATPYTVQEITYQLRDSISQVALILNQGRIFSDGTSTILDLTVNPPQILRQGHISNPAIEAVLRSLEIS